MSSQTYDGLREGAASESSVARDRNRRPAAGNRRTSRNEELRRYRRFVELSDAALWCVELDPPVPLDLPAEQALAYTIERGALVECNPSLARELGLDSRNAWRGMDLEAFLSKSPQTLGHLQAFWQAGLHLDEAEGEEVQPDGTTRYYATSLIGIVSGDTLAQIWGTRRDITERKELEARLLESQRMEAVGQLAGGVAHDFNNMLMVIAGNLDFVLGQRTLASEDEEALLEALRAADRASELTRQLLTFSRRTMLRLEAVDLAKVVESSFRMLRRVVHEGIRFEFDLDEDAPRVQADVGHIEQMLVNLAVNARDAMPGGGVLRVSLASGPKRGERDEVVLQISDTGGGMDAQTRARMFEPFFTSKDRSLGAGLGLSVVYGIVKRCGGSIETESEIGRGTTFTVRLPAARDRVPGAEVSMDTSDTRRGTILVLEDRPDVLALCRRLLERSGHRVLSAEHPDDALAQAASHEGEIDVLLCDVVMPGTNGAEFARTLLERSPSTRVILMSGYSELPEACQETPPESRFMTKPFSPAQLEEQIQLALAEAEETRRPKPHQVVDARVPRSRPSSVSRSSETP